MMIEFMGMPGCGKTFFSSKLVEEMKKEGRVCINFTELSRTSIIYKFIFKILQVFVKANPKYRRMRSKLSVILAKYKDVKAAYNTVNIDYYINKIVLQAFLYKIYRKKVGLYILDEGIVQQIANIRTNYAISDGDVERIISEISLAIEPIYIKNSIEDSVTAMIHRNRHVCYIDELEGNELFKFLCTYRESCDMLEIKYSAIVIDKDEQIGINIQKVSGGIL